MAAAQRLSPRSARPCRCLKRNSAARGARDSDRHGAGHALEAARRVLPRPARYLHLDGFCGALRTGFASGDILAARLVSEAGEPVAVASDRELLSTAVECGAQQVERFLTSRTWSPSARRSAIWGARRTPWKWKAI